VAVLRLASNDLASEDSYPTAGAWPRTPFSSRGLFMYLDTCYHAASEAPNVKRSVCVLCVHVPGLKDARSDWFLWRAGG